MDKEQLPVRLSNAHFPPTLMSLVYAAIDRSTPQGADAYARICRDYWPPLYAFLRRQGESPNKAEDYVQGFFEKMTRKGFLAQMNSERGRFRTFLRTALWNFVLNQKREEDSDTRGGSRPHVSIDNFADVEHGPANLSAAFTADEIYDRRWAADLVSRARDELHRAYISAGREKDFEELSPWLEKPSGPGAYVALARRRGVTENAIAVAVRRLRGEYRDCLRNQVLPTLESPADVDAELKYLLQVLIADCGPPDRTR